MINTTSAPQKKYELGKYKKAMCLFGYIAFFCDIANSTHKCSSSVKINI